MSSGHCDLICVQKSPVAAAPLAVAPPEALDAAAALVVPLLEVLLLLQADSANASALIPATVAVILRWLRGNTRPDLHLPVDVHVRALTRHCEWKRFHRHTASPEKDIARNDYVTRRAQRHFRRAVGRFTRPNGWNRDRNRLRGSRRSDDPSGETPPPESVPGSTHHPQPADGVRRG